MDFLLKCKIQNFLTKQEGFSGKSVINMFFRIFFGRKAGKVMNLKQFWSGI